MNDTRPFKNLLRPSFTPLLLTSSLLIACGASDDANGDGTGTGRATEGNQAENPGGEGNGGPVISPSEDSLINVDGVGQGNGENPPNNICQSYEAVSQSTPPLILILLDQSGSMTQTISGDAQSRWSYARPAVVDLVKTWENQAEFGFIGYPLQPLPANSDSDPSTTCNAQLKVAPALVQGSAIEASIPETIASRGHTPTRQALVAAYAELSKAEHNDKNKYVVLVTDGMANCKDIGPDDPTNGRLYYHEETADAVTTLREIGVKTHVVGYGIEGLKSTQWQPNAGDLVFEAEKLADAMALAGGTEKHIKAKGSDLADILSGITASAAPCSFELNESPEEGPEFVRVTIDDTDYPLDDEWTLEGDKTIALREDGEACGVLRDGAEHNVKIQVECERVVIIR